MLNFMTGLKPGPSVVGLLKPAVLALTLLDMQNPPPAEWLPAGVHDGLVQQLSERLEQTGLDWSLERRNHAAAMAIAAIRARLDAIGVAGVQKLGPALTRLNLVASDNLALHAMSRYQMCNAADFIAFERRAKTASEDARINTAMRLTAGTMVVVYLRHEYVSGGGTGEQVEAFLTHDSFQPPINRMQDDETELRAVQAECAPVFKSLMAR